jgi:isopentenyl-diphosphate Delta-isomerase
MTEFIDLVDEQNNVIGVTDVVTAHEKRQLHRVVGIFLFDNQGSLYLQSDSKYGRLDLSVGGHVHRGETYDAAAHREMKEELGMETNLLHISTFMPTNAKMGHFWSLYQGSVSSTWIFIPTEEVSAVVKMSMQEIAEKVKSSPEIFTHGFINAYMEFERVSVK